MRYVVELTLRRQESVVFIINYFRENMSKTDFAKFLKVFIKSQNLNISQK